MKIMAECVQKIELDLLPSQDRSNETRLTQVSNEEALQRTAITARLALVYWRERGNQSMVSAQSTARPQPQPHALCCLAGGITAPLASDGRQEARQRKT